MKEEDVAESTLSKHLRCLAARLPVVAVHDNHAVWAIPVCENLRCELPGRPREPGLRVALGEVDVALLKLVLVALCVLGAAGVWEIFEFAMSNIIEGYDPQVWHAAVEGGANGGNPLWDTMYDMIVAVIGTAIFYITLAIDVATKGKLYRGTLDARREFSSDRDSEAVRAEGREQNALCNGEEERSE